MSSRGRGRDAIDVTRKDTGKSETLEEVAVYTVRGDKIAREQFFYVGEH